MVPDITRRTLLAGSGTALGMGLLATGQLAPEWLPDPVTDTLLQLYPDPPDHLWQPEISDAHADEAVALLEATVEHANALKERIDVDSISGDYAHNLRDKRDPSGGWLESATEESDPRERLFAATYGMSFAGETVGYAKVALDDVDIEELRRRSDRLWTDAEEVLDSLGEYPVASPSRDLAYVYFVERALSFARMDAPRLDRETEGAGSEAYSPYEIGSIHGSQVRATQRIRNARYYRDLYHEQLGEDARPYADELSAALATFTDAIEEYPPRREMWERATELREAEETPYAVARWELVMLCFDDDFRWGYDEGEHQHGHAVQQIVEVGRALMARRAHDFALGRLDVDPEATDYDSGRAFREKRRAVETFRSVRADHDSPFAGILAEEAASRIRSGDIGIKMRDHDDGMPAWRDRVKATVYYLVGNGTMGELDDVLDVILAEEN